MRKTVLGLLLGFIISSSAFAGPLGDAAKKGDVAEIERLLASGADPNEPDAIASPLHWAAMNGHATAVELLAASGAILDAQSDMLGTPLHAASGFGQVETVRALLGAQIKCIVNLPVPIKSEITKKHLNLKPEPPIHRFISRYVHLVLCVALTVAKRSATRWKMPIPSIMDLVALSHSAMTRTSPAPKASMARFN